MDFVFELRDLQPRLVPDHKDFPKQIRARVQVPVALETKDSESIDGQKSHETKLSRQRQRHSDRGEQKQGLKSLLRAARFASIPKESIA